MKAKEAVRTGPKRKRLVSDNSQFINLIKIYERHSQEVGGCFLAAGGMGEVYRAGADGKASRSRLFGSLRQAEVSSGQGGSWNGVIRPHCKPRERRWETH